jgi:5'-3' exonuclease
MGIPDFLPNVLPSAGTQVDLRRYRDGIDVMTRDAHRKRQRIRRPLRIGLDVSHWTYRACLRFGDMLADPSHLTNNGRYQMVQRNNDAKDNGHQASSMDTLLEQKEKEVVQTYVSHCVRFVMQRIQSLQRETNAELLVVFDGASPPIKDATVQKRAKERNENARIRDAPLDMDSMRIISNKNNNENGNQNKENNHNAASFQQALEDMQQNLMERTKANRRAGAGKHHSTIIEHLLSALRINHIPFLVAPYEADGQLAWLSREKFIDVVVTEDSDMIAQGGQCVLYKMELSTRADNDQGNDSDQPSFVPRGILLLRENLGAVTISIKSRRSDNRSLGLRDMSDVMLAVMFVAMGSDYCDKLKGIGITKACEIVHEAFLEQKESCPLESVFQQLFQKANYDKTIRSDLERQAEYKKNFLAALLIYRHPIVYNPFRQRCVVAFRGQGDPELISYEPYANLLEDDKRLQEICGNFVEPPMATFIAEGWVSARSQKLYESARQNPNLPKALKEYFELENAESSQNNDGILDIHDNRSEHKEDDSLSRADILDDPEPTDPKGSTSREESQATKDDTQADNQDTSLDTQNDSIQLDTQEH